MPIHNAESLAEYKTVSPFARRHWTHDEPGLYALIQANWGMLVTGAEWELVAAQIGFGDQERDRLTYRVERNEDLIGELALAHERFWGYVDRDEEPPVDGFSRTAHAIRLLYPPTAKGKGKIVTLPPEGGWPAVQGEIERIKDQVEQLGRRKKELEHRIDLEMGKAGAEEAVIPPATPEGSEALWRRMEIAVKAQTCKGCSAETRKPYTYTRFQQDG